jgi:hypothetical protein
MAKEKKDKNDFKAEIKKLYLSGLPPRKIKERLPELSWSAKEIGNYLSKEKVVRKKKEIKRKKEKMSAQEIELKSFICSKRKII